ncbi:CGNR zinc finger domain-containing protein [Streptomyces justiciae]|uniref:CGNR zinc finger domain-containing protein n=1 Tax=Streptomyces justiciae TaxID=2780140 RepID=A0ABU3LMJ4_9ACTN|nr:CGNR zinc finger domain-containing protein [Streptomyces justiciae]MDT7839989.1 CGNR zinc finger domain-containing protein [Streptomyces justiciae]
MQYGDYVGNVTRLAVELANTRTLDQHGELVGTFFEEHGITPPPGGDYGELPDLVHEALAQVVDGTAPEAVHRLLRDYPPEMHLSDHDGLGGWHLHFSRNGTPAERWAGQLIAAQLALVVAGEPAVTLGRCAAAGCDNYFVDQSRNRTRRFCSNACASRTTVAAYRARTAKKS